MEERLNTINIDSTMVSGWITTCMEEEFILGKMEESMRVITNSIKSMG